MAIKTHLELTKAYIILCIFVGCTKPVPGPDKQFVGTVEGASTAAGSGAITGFQLGAGTGPGALVGAGIGALVGGIKGATVDSIEEDRIRLTRDIEEEKRKIKAKEVLKEHYDARIEVYPSRDIYPADYFFYKDNADVNASAKYILEEIIKINASQSPWSRFLVASYVRTNDTESVFAKKLAEDRAKKLSNILVKLGLDPRRIVSRGVVMSNPLVLDPQDDPERYNQAIEFKSMDK